MTTTDTPRTDAAIELYGDRPFMVPAVPVEFAEGLERELDASKAEVERLRAAMRSFIDFLDDNLGTTADWPMEAAFDDEETCQRHCDHLNAMKRIVKPEGIN